MNHKPIIKEAVIIDSFHEYLNPSEEEKVLERYPSYWAYNGEKCRKWREGNKKTVKNNGCIIRYDEEGTVVKRKNKEGVLFSEKWFWMKSEKGEEAYRVFIRQFVRENKLEGLATFLEGSRNFYKKKGLKRYFYNNLSKVETYVVELFANALREDNYSLATQLAELVSPDTLYKGMYPLDFAKVYNAKDAEGKLIEKGAKELTDFEVFKKEFVKSSKRTGVVTSVISGGFVIVSLVIAFIVFIIALFCMACSDGGFFYCDTGGGSGIGGGSSFLGKKVLMGFSCLFPVFLITGFLGGLIGGGYAVLKRSSELERLREIRGEVRGQVPGTYASVSQKLSPQLNPGQEEVEYQVPEQAEQEIWLEKRTKNTPPSYSEENGVLAGSQLRHTVN